MQWLHVVKAIDHNWPSLLTMESSCLPRQTLWVSAVEEYVVYLCLKKKKQRHLHRFHNNTNLNISFGQQWSSTGLFKEVLTEGKFIPSHVTTIISGADMNTEQKISDTCSINYLNITFQTRCKNNMKSTNIHAGCR